jgi:hypothetical protein
MKLTETETAALYREMTARRDRGPDCLDDDALLRAAANDLSPSERARIAAHIGQCSDCAREYRVARAMRPFDAEARAAFVRPIPRWAAAVAAAIVTIAIAAYFWRTTGTIRDLRHAAAVQQGDLANARRALAAERVRPHTAAPVVPLAPPRPQLGVPIVDVDPEPTRGGAPAPASVEVPKGTDEFALVLHLPEVLRAPAEIEVTGAKNDVVWRGTLPGAGATITMTLHRQLVPPGSYTVRVRSGRRQTLFPFRVTYR